MNSKVYIIRASAEEGQDVISQKSRRLFREARFDKCFKEHDFTALKVHVGEGKNNTYIKAPCFKGLIDELKGLKTKPFITDTSTLYVERRSNAVDHAMLAHEHGFNPEVLGIPFIPSDGLLGTSETAVQIDAPLNKQVSIASEILRCQSILSLAHFTGHVATCAGGTLKTIGMGCASRKGKMRQHSALKPWITDDCTLCGECAKHCPTDAITIGKAKARIDKDKCIGCAECVAVCRFHAVKYDWRQESSVLQQHIAEHALGALKDKKGRSAFFNYIISLTKDCDCFKTPNMPRFAEDIGIAASTDPVALDKATIDLIEDAGGKRLEELIQSENLDPSHQIEHAEAIGLGSTKYELIKV